MKIRTSLKDRAAVGLAAAVIGGMSLVVAPSASAHTGLNEKCIPRVLPGSSATNYFCVEWSLTQTQSGPYGEANTCKVGNHSSSRIYVTGTSYGTQSVLGTNTIHFTSTTNYTIEPGATRTWTCFADSRYGDPHTGDDGRLFMNIAWAIAGQSSYTTSTNYDSH